jgi:hypothetical protein
MKRASVPTGRRHGLRARLALEGRVQRTTLTMRGDARSYLWTTDRVRPKAVLRA